jgi:hypothetical protein
LEAIRSADVELPPAIPERPYFLESWKRCSEAGISQALDNSVNLRRVEPSELKVRLDRSQDLVNVAGPLLAGFSTALGAVEHVIYLTDRDGIVLCSVGSRDSMLAYGLLPGFDWSEQRMGTNGAGTAIATNRPVAVIGPDHYQLPFRDATCLAAPIHSPRGELIGAVDLSTHVNDAEVFQLTQIVNLAKLIKYRLTGKISVLLIGTELLSSDARRALCDWRFAVVVARTVGEGVRKAVILRPDAIVLAGVRATPISELIGQIKFDQRTASVPIVKVFDSSVDDAPYSPETESYLVQQPEAEHLGQAVSRALGKSVGKAHSKTTRWSHHGEQVMK